MEYKNIFTMAKNRGYNAMFTDLLLPDIYVTEKMGLIELSLIQRWLRTEYNIIIETQYKHDLKNMPIFTWHIRGQINNNSKPLDGFYNYDKALMAGIKEALKII